MAISHLPTNQLQPNPFQPRNKLQKEDIEDLAESIRQVGILEPLVIAETPAGYQIIAGERRWRAAKLAGLDEVPVFIKRTTPKGMLEMALVENVQRLNLSPIERAQAFKQLLRDFKYTKSQLASKVGKSPSYVSNTLKLLLLPDAVKDGLIGGLITEGHARAIAAIDSESIMIDLYKIVLKENASVRRCEELARRYVNNPNKGVGTKPRLLEEDKQLESWQKRIGTIFAHTKAKVKITRSNRQTKVSIALKGNPEETQQDLETLLELASKYSGN